MKYCKSCGAELVDDAVVCPKCGVATTEIKAAPTKHNTIGLISFICAIVGIILSFIQAIPSWITSILNLAAFILGIIGIVQAKKKNEKKGFAVAGLILSLLGVIIVIIFLIVGIVLVGSTM